jgi:hypothetical protein
MPSLARQRPDGPARGLAGLAVDIELGARLTLKEDEGRGLRLASGQIGGDVEMATTLATD